MSVGLNRAPSSVLGGAPSAQNTQGLARTYLVCGFLVSVCLCLCVRGLAAPRLFMSLLIGVVIGPQRSTSLSSPLHTSATDDSSGSPGPSGVCGVTHHTLTSHITPHT